MKLLEVNGLQASIKTKWQTYHAIEDVTFSVEQGEILGIVGESGCGKSMTALSILRLVASPPVYITGGEIRYRGKNLLEMDEKEIRKIRGNKISMIFQEPMTSLNPVYTVGNQITEVIRLHQKVGKEEAQAQALQMLRMVGIPAPEQRIKEYPHQLSGGMRQRVMIAMALACRPELLIADEPTTALDVTIQAQILEELKNLQREFGMSIILITHDLGVVADMAQNMLVMYGGEVVEYGPTKELFRHPRHPYTEGLLRSIPRLDEAVRKLNVIKGVVPSLDSMPEGCRFCPRCEYATERCHKEKPPLREIDGCKVRCWQYQQEKQEGGK